jgi:hypothetical protein
MRPTEFSFQRSARFARAGCRSLPAPVLSTRADRMNAGNGALVFGVRNLTPCVKCRRLTFVARVIRRSEYRLPVSGVGVYEGGAWSDHNKPSMKLRPGTKMCPE